MRLDDTYCVNGERGKPGGCVVMGIRSTVTEATLARPASRRGRMPDLMRVRSELKTCRIRIDLTASNREALYAYCGTKASNLPSTLAATARPPRWWVTDREKAQVNQFVGACLAGFLSCTCQHRCVREHAAPSAVYRDPGEKRADQNVDFEGTNQLTPEDLRTNAASWWWQSVVTQLPH